MENKTEFINVSAIYLDFFKRLEKIISNLRDLQLIFINIYENTSSHSYKKEFNFPFLLYA